MQLTVDALAQRCEEVVLRQSAQLVYPRVDGCGTLVVYASLIAEDARLHIVQVVLFALLEGGVVALLLELLGFQVVARVELIADGQRHDVQIAQLVGKATLAAHRQHFQHRVLRMVTRVLGTSLALCYPDVLALLGHGIVYIAAHQLTGAHHLVGRQSAAHREGLVHPHQSLDPGIDQEVVADAYLHRGGIAVAHQHHVEEGRVEHDVAVVREEGVPVRLVRRQCLVVKRAAVGMLADDVLHDGFHEPLLEVQRRVDTRK